MSANLSNPPKGSFWNRFAWRLIRLIRFYSELVQEVLLGSVIIKRSSSLGKACSTYERYLMRKSNLGALPSLFPASVFLIPKLGVALPSYPYLFRWPLPFWAYRYFVSRGFSGVWGERPDWCF